ncbi:hypothetical protein BKP35_00420 [Anaerobacillus arseniciselenatis]|uniref:Cxxc_20_cxxc protein n=1 Tax=Anaerobacillus arseniciselenatis TaxID=85682 RepID=A0A1S2LT39_9BACI|nr:hypothetical protein BKP35_00420 [Anaerobacillus arseniciselenatis]
MKLQKCNVCMHQFGWKKTYKSVFFKGWEMQCSKCETHYVLDLRSKWIFYFTPSLVIIALNNLFSFDFYITLFGTFFSLILISFLFPYVMKFSPDI